MTDIDRSVRMRALLERRMWAIGAILVLLVLTSGWWAYQVHMVPEFEQEERVTDQWEERTDFDHSAVIERDSEIWSEGERVWNRPIYYLNLSTTLDGNYSYWFEADDGELTANSTAILRIMATDDDEILWEVTENLTESEAESIGPDETHTVNFSVEIPSVNERIERIEGDLGAQEGLIDVRVDVRTDLEGMVENDEVDTTYESELHLVSSQETFRVHDRVVVDEPHEDRTFVQVPVDPSPVEELGSIALLALTLFGTIGLAAGHLTGQFEISEAEREMIELERDREEFDEWITTGTFPADREFEATVLVDDLVGLVDVAIDTNNRVIEDNQLGVSTVIDRETSYVFVHPDSPAKDWIVNYADTTLDEFEP